MRRRCAHCGRLQEDESHWNRKALGGAPRMNSHDFDPAIPASEVKALVDRWHEVCGRAAMNPTLSDGIYVGAGIRKCELELAALLEDK